MKQRTQQQPDDGRPIVMHRRAIVNHDSNLNDLFDDEEAISGVIDSTLAQTALIARQSDRLDFDDDIPTLVLRPKEKRQ